MESPDQAEARVRLPQLRLDELLEELQARLYKPPVARASRHLEPDCAHIHRELRRPGVTLQLL